MKKALFRRAAALLLVLALLVLPVSALTVDQARELLRDNYVDPVPEEVLALPTIEEMLDALGDPYTQYLTAEEYQAFLGSMSDESLVGIGVSVSGALTAQDPFQLLEVYEDGPAYEGGLRPGDVIVGVDHVDVQGMDPDAIVEMIRGEEDTQVAITYLRDGQRRTVTLTRKPVVVAATSAKMISDNVCLIQCTTWGEETLDHFRDILGRYNRQTECWVIDLRNNPGGLSEAAADVAGLFCGPGNMLSLRYRTDDAESPDGYAYDFYPTRYQPATHKPVVILVDGYTASASEAFTAALRDYGVAVVVGTRTYGKGVAQGLWDQRSRPDYFPDGDCLKITIARFYSPRGNTNDTLGVVPDFLVEGQAAENLALNLAQAFADQPEACQETYEEVLGLFLSDAGFADTADSPYADAITPLHAYGLVAGKGDGQFHPTDTLTRAELAQMLANALNSWIPENAAGFDDVAQDAWYADAVSAIVAQGMMEGTGEGAFAPDRVLTRQELFTVLGRLAAWLNDDLDLTVRQSGPEDWDLNVLKGYDVWARPSVWLLSGAMDDGSGGLLNLLWDEPDAIDPTAPATREEAAKVLYDILYYLDILP